MLTGKAPSLMVYVNTFILFRLIKCKHSMTTSLTCTLPSSERGTSENGEVCTLYPRVPLVPLLQLWSHYADKYIYVHVSIYGLTWFIQCVQVYVWEIKKPQDLQHGNDFSSSSLKSWSQPQMAASMTGDKTVKCLLLRCDSKEHI